MERSLDRLERRIAALEEELRDVSRELARTRREAAEAAGATGVEAAPSLPPEDEPAVRDPAAPAVPDAREGRDLEAWLGRNGLLVVGLLALVTATGFLLKYAFDQGWISPGLRVGAGFVGGIGLAAWGERFQARGLLSYGSALVGGGGAIAYLALWAAAGPYALLPQGLGVGLLAVLSGLVVVSAARTGTPLLGALAALGAFLAPLLLPRAAGSPDTLFLYCGLVGISVGAVSARPGWWAPFVIAALGYFLLPAFIAMEAAPDLLVVPYLALGGAAALGVCRRHGWTRSRAALFALVWIVLAAAAADLGAVGGWTLLALLPLVALPTFLPALRTTGSDETPLGQMEWAYLILGAGAWAGVSRIAAPPPLEAWPLALFAVISSPYVLGARARGIAGLLGLGFALLAWGVADQFGGLERTAGLLALALLSGALTRPAHLAPARWTGFALAALGAWRLLSVDVVERSLEAPPLIGPWALTLYLATATLVGLATILRGAPAPEETAGRVAGLRAALWIAAGIVLLGGGTQEILFAFDRPGAPGGPLVRDLAVSAFWLLYAGGLIAWGFWRDERSVRVAGLVVTGLAVLKVVFLDLTRLEALYRVGSFCLLAVLALLAAYGYHRRSEEEAPISAEG